MHEGYMEGSRQPVLLSRHYFGLYVFVSKLCGAAYADLGQFHAGDAL